MLHDQAGDWIAFRVDGRYLYNTSATIFGWCLPDQPDLVLAKDGQYLGEIVGDRLFRQTTPPFVPNPGYLSDPGGVGSPSNPGNKGYASLPSGMEDVPRDRLR